MHSCLGPGSSIPQRNQLGSNQKMTSPPVCIEHATINHILGGMTSGCVKEKSLDPRAEAGGAVGAAWYPPWGIIASLPPNAISPQTSKVDALRVLSTPR